MKTPKFKIGDKVYRWSEVYNAPLCSLCGQEEFSTNSMNNEKNYRGQVDENTVIGVTVSEGAWEGRPSSSVSYALDDRWRAVDEDELYATYEEAEAAMKAHIQDVLRRVKEQE